MSKMDVGRICDHFWTEWWRSCWEPAEWFASHPECIPLWGEAPGVDILTLSMDIMHMKWLGTDSYYLGSLLVYLVDMKLPGSAQENITTLWQEIDVIYKQIQVPTRFSCITLGMIRAGKSPFPCLKGKASEVKWLIPVLVKVLEKYLRDTEFEKLMYRGLLQSWAIDQCLEQNIGVPRCQWVFCHNPGAGVLDWGSLLSQPHLSLMIIFEPHEWYMCFMLSTS